MRNLPGRFLLTITILLLLGIIPATRQAAAQDLAALSVTLSAGFEDHIKLGTWFPVRVLLENNGPQIDGEIVVTVDDGAGAGSFFTYPISMPSISRKEIAFLAYASSWNSSLTWRFRDSSGKSVIVQKSNLILHSEGDVLYGVAAANPTPFNQLSLIDPVSGTASIVMVDIENLPENSRGLESLSILVLCGVDTGSMTEDQSLALAEWVQTGGRLLLCGGPDWQKTLAGLQANPAATSLLPITKITTTSIETEGAGFAEIFTLLPSDTAPFSAAGSPLTVLAAGEVIPGSTVLARDNQNHPLAVVRSFGSGSVIYLSADPSLPPFSTWIGLEQFFRVLLNSTQPQANWNSGIGQWYSAVSAAQTFSSLNMPPVLLICGFLFIYMLILGPVNYVILRILKRRELGWITTPVLVIVITAVVFSIGSLTRTGRPILNRLALVQIWPQQTSMMDSNKIPAQVEGVVGIYSPSRATYQVDFEKPFVAHVPPADSNAMADMVFTQDGENFSVKDVRIDVSGIRSLGVEGNLILDDFPYDLKAKTEGGSTRLVGFFTNTSPYRLENALILNASQTWPLGDIEPGQTVPLDLSVTGSSASSGAITPAKPMNPSMGPVSPVFGPSNPMDIILGTSDYWRDRETYRRYNFLSSFAYNSYYGYGYMQVYGFQLVAWSSAQVIPVSIADHQSDGEDTTLFMIALKPQFEFSDPVLKLDSGMFNWVGLESSNNPATPYNMYLYSQGSYTLEFSPSYAFDYSRVQSLAFNLEALNMGSQPDLQFITFYLYNFSTGDYEALSGIDWGVNEIVEPEKFVGSGGIIRLKVQSDLGYLELGRTDFTMVIER